MSLPANPTEDADAQSLFTRAFWLAFVANVLLVSANVMTFRFAEFVSFLGGTEEITGRIVSVGLLGSLVLRAFLGQALDYFGIRLVWMTSCLVFLVGMVLTITAPDVGIQIYVSRIVFVIGMASMFASSMSHIQTLAPEGRRTEIIAKFGASGFVGMTVGAQAGDAVFNYFDESRLLYQVLFGSTMVLGLMYLYMAHMMTKDVVHTKPQTAPPMHKLLFRYWPPIVLIVTMMMGLGFGVTMTFLTRYATELGLSGISTFFTSYAITAFVMRLLSSRWSRTLGRHKLIVIGLACHAVGQESLIFVTADWHFIPPAFFMGVGHALLFPCIISLGVGSFPEQYRGTGTAITLAAVDVGTIATAPMMGWLIDHHGFHSMFYTASTILICSSALYWYISNQMHDSDLEVSKSKNVPDSEPVTLETEPREACVTR